MKNENMYHQGALKIIVLKENGEDRYFDANTDHITHIAMLDILNKRIERGAYVDDELKEATEIAKDCDYARAEDFLFQRGGISFSYLEDSKAY